MHGHTPRGGDAGELTPEQRRGLRRDGAEVAARARTLLPDEFVVGSELVERSGDVEATVAVRPPGAGVVSAGFTAGEERDRDALARELAAGAALAAKHAPTRRPPTAR